MIRDGKLVPILGSVIRQNRIFDINWDNDIGLSDENRTPADDDTSVDEELSIAWARDIEYPLADAHQLARVAQFHCVTTEFPAKAKREYLHFLKEALLDVAADDESVQDKIDGLQANILNMTFSEIVSTLDYPQFTDTRPDPLRVLAKLRLPLYVTTSYFDFMERALIKEGARDSKGKSTVRTRFCRWNKGLPEEDIDDQYRVDPDEQPTRDAPIVYHLYGIEQYPPSLVLSEDDYMDFLLKFAKHTDQAKPFLPHYLKKALSTSPLLLLGYRLQDLDFRVLFRGLINDPDGEQSPKLMYNVAIQLDPEYQRIITDAKGAKDYLERYFDRSKFQVNWQSIDKFIVRLWHEYNNRGQGKI
jgi:hypothetical protein